MPDFTVSGGETREVSGEHQIGQGNVTVDGTLRVTGDTTFVFDSHGSVDGGLRNGVSVSGRVEFDGNHNLIMDCTAPQSFVNTSIDGGTLGDGNGTIYYRGIADFARDSGGIGYALHVSGDCEANRVAWMDGSGVANMGTMTSSIGFSWHEGNADMTFRNCWIRGWSKSLFYWTRQGGNASLTIDNCLIQASGSRGISTVQGGLTIRNTNIDLGCKFAHQTHNCCPASWTQAITIMGQTQPDPVNLENVHVRYNPNIEGCNVESEGDVVVGTGVDVPSNPPQFNISNCAADAGAGDIHPAANPGQWATGATDLGNPIDEPPQGNGSSDPDPDPEPSFDHTLVVQGEGTEGQYRVTLEPVGGTADAAPITSGGCATELSSGVGFENGEIVGYLTATDCDSWEFTGHATSVTRPQGASLELDGSTVTPDQLAALTAPDDAQDGENGDGGDGGDATGALALAAAYYYLEGQLF